MRHNEGGTSRERRLQVYDLLRCKARVLCKVSLEGRFREVDGKGYPVIGMTMFMRTGPRSFKNDSAVIGIFNKACRNVDGCRLTVAYANNLTFCQQVLNRHIGVSTRGPIDQHVSNGQKQQRHGILPKGWLKLAGIGQYVYHWIASWSGMNHRGAWRDPGGDLCPFPDDDRRCMSVYKKSRIGYNESYFSEWARSVLSDVKLRKAQDISNKSRIPVLSSCGC
ncbi:UNVERIFIED_CONTAM: hypothetical protein Slati_3265300 [Sesamum latifolium]|uniref:Uncharacterized protein n=1 Tax=Sesamum latifolium TaxID=2727402 RepID=A0AAW2UYV2_9LAMI